MNKKTDLLLIVANRIREALINTDLTVSIHDLWDYESTTNRFDIVIYRKIHPIAVFEIVENFKDYDDFQSKYQMVRYGMNLTNSRFGIICNNEEFVLNDRITKKPHFNQIEFEDLIRKIISPEKIEVFKEDKELVQELIREAANIHLQSNPEFLNFIQGGSFLSKIQFDHNSSKYYFSDDEGGIDSFENRFFIKLFGEFTDTQICRYTSLNTIFEMLKNLSFRMNGIVGMNDKSEVNYIETYFSRSNNHTSIAKPLNRTHYKTIAAINNRYITSCSKIGRKDDLTLWRLYSDDAKGVCLVFDVKKNNLNKHVLLQKVKYADGNGDHKELDFLKQIMDEVDLKTGFKFEFRKLNYWKHFFKANDYSIEEEVRLLIIDNDYLSKLRIDWVMTYTHSIINPVIDFGLNSISFPIQLKEILVGPKCPEQQTNLVQLQELLRRKKREIIDKKIDSKIEHINVEISKINHYR